MLGWHKKIALPVDAFGLRKTATREVGNGIIIESVSTSASGRFGA